MVSTKNLKLQGIKTGVHTERCPLSSKQNQIQIFLKCKETQKFLDDKWLCLRLGVAGPWRMVARLVRFNYPPIYIGGSVVLAGAPTPGGEIPDEEATHRSCSIVGSTIITETYLVKL